MKVRGDNAPAGAFTLEAQPKKPGYYLVRFYENAREFTETMDELTITGWEYDEYHLEMKGSGNLQADVLANYDALLLQAKTAELGAEEASKTPLQRKLEELSAACHEAITAGCTVTLSDGTAKNFSLEETDQINLSNAYAAVQAGAAGYPYHADREMCRQYTAADITAIAQAATAHKLYHTTYCNHLMTWARRAEASELVNITYGAALPEDLAENMQAIIDAQSVT